MKRRDFLEKWGLSGLKIKLPFLEGEFRPQDADRPATWDLYVELLTRITTQYLSPEDGDEEAALQSVSMIFRLPATFCESTAPVQENSPSWQSRCSTRSSERSPPNGTVVRWRVPSRTGSTVENSAPNSPPCSRVYAPTRALSPIWRRSRILRPWRKPAPSHAPARFH
jgi:hypothetical protein